MLGKGMSFYCLPNRAARRTRLFQAKGAGYVLLEAQEPTKNVWWSTVQTFVM